MRYAIYVPCAYIMTRNDIFKYKWYFLIGYLASSALQDCKYFSKSVSTYGNVFARDFWGVNVILFHYVIPGRKVQVTAISIRLLSGDIIYS